MTTTGAVLQAPGLLPSLAALREHLHPLYPEHGRDTGNEHWAE